MSGTKKVVLCGGSNGTSFFAGMWSSGRLPVGQLDVSVVSRRPERFQKPLNIVETVPNWTDHLSVVGTSVFAPHETVKYQSRNVKAFSYDQLDEGIRGTDSVWVCSPVSAYKNILGQVVPAMGREAKRAGRDAPGADPLVLVVMYGQGGVDMIALQAGGGRLPPGVALCVLKNFPALIKRTTENSVTNFGWHPDCGWHSVLPHSAADYTYKLLIDLMPEISENKDTRIKAKPHVLNVSNTLLCTLSGSNQFLHPAAIVGVVGAAPGKTFTEAPKVYRGQPPETFTVLAELWQEQTRLVKVLEKGLDVPMWALLGNTYEVRWCLSWNLSEWGIWAREWLWWMAVNLTSRLNAARMPMVPLEGDKKGELIFNVKSRFITDDIGFGLCVLMGFGELAGVYMPYTAGLIAKLQQFLGKEFVVVKGNKWVLKGRDVHETGAPQAYGIRSLEQYKRVMAEGSLPTPTAKL